MDYYEQLNLADLSQMGPNPPSPAKPHDVSETQHVLATPEGHISDERGLLARPIKPHSKEKAHYVSRYANTVSVAMAGKFEIWWLEPPGNLLRAWRSAFLEQARSDVFYELSVQSRCSVRRRRTAVLPAVAHPPKRRRTLPFARMDRYPRCFASRAETML